MAYLKRKIDAILRDWKASENHLPLVVRGARQVGKTASILEFARQSYENVVYVNFVEQPTYRQILADGYGTADVVRNLSRITPSFSFEPGTLLVFDEMQALPDIATTLKFFKLDGRFDVICSGSLLGLHYHEIESNSVGYKTDVTMQSMDFEEFLWAKGYDVSFTDDMLAHMVDGRPFSALEHRLLLRLFLDYCVLGGMPAVVRTYIERDTFEGTLAMQRQLLLDYEEDIRKYASGLDQGRILHVFRQIPAQLAKENKKFQISKVAKGARFKDYFGCIEWLADAGIVNICHALQTPELPLRGNYDATRYKLYYGDTGLLVASLDEEAQEDLRANGNLGVYKGALYENLVGEALVKSGYDLFYYKKENSTLEEDFFVRDRTSLVPVEVKATNNHAKSPATLVKSKRYEDIRYGIKLANANIGEADGIYTFPYYCVFLLRRYLKNRSSVSPQRAWRSLMRS